MKIVIAPDSFKESMTAMEAAVAFEKGFREVMPEATLEKVPMADGGEGTVQSLVDATDGEIIHKIVTGPLGTPVEAFFGMLGDSKTAVIEMAAASGLHLVPKEKRNPLKTTTKGTGELILAAIEHGADHIIIGLGGSATNDGGAGMAQALGAKLVDQNGEDIGFGGGSLRDLAKLDVSLMDERISNVRFEVACDVDNPLTGERGASAIFGPQKGADPEMVKELDHYLTHYASLINRDMGKEVDAIPGAGAAGGLGAGVLAFLDAELKRGIDIVMEAAKLEDAVKDADLVITGEGKIDSQTIYGKTPIGVAKLAKRHGVPVIGIAGLIADDSDAVFDHGIDALFSIVPGAVSLEDALLNAKSYAYQSARNIAAVVNMNR